MITIVNFRGENINLIIFIFLIALIYTLTCCFNIGNKKLKEKKEKKNNFISYDGVKWKYTEQSKENKYVEGVPYCPDHETQLVLIDIKSKDNFAWIYECVICKKEFKLNDYEKSYYGADIIMRQKWKNYRHGRLC